MSHRFALTNNNNKNMNKSTKRHPPPTLFLESRNYSVSSRRYDTIDRKHSFGSIFSIRSTQSNQSVVSNTSNASNVSNTSNTSNASSTRTYRRTVIEVGSMLLTSSGALTLSKVEGLVRRASTNSNAENDSCTVSDYCSHGNDGTNNSSANSPEMRNPKSEEASLLPSTASVRAI